MRYLVFLILILLPSSIFAQEMFSPSFKLELEQIESTTEAKTEKLNSLQLKRFLDTGYIIQTQQADTLQFSISDSTLHFNDLKPGAETSQSVLTTVTSTDLYGYQLIAFPIQGLETTNNDQIPPTQCNGNDEACTVLHADKWTSNNAFGWGYSVSGPDSPKDFIDESFFRPFKTGEAVVIAHHPAVNSQRSTELTIKTVISPEMPKGNYSSIIKLIALPKL